MRSRRRRRMRIVHSDRMGCGIEPRKEEFCGGRDARNRRRQHVRHRYARCRRSAGVEGHITSERNASEPERSHVRPQAAEPTGPHREGEEPKPMMHGHEKSDSAIVAMKPPNKAGRPAAEAVERRAEAKENANRCRTCRTQCRESVSPTPERVRKAEASRQTSEVGAVCRKAARTVVCPVKAGMFSRGQTCRGRSQSPVVWIAEEMETEPSKPIDKTSRGGVTSHRAVTTVNALWPRK